MTMKLSRGASSAEIVGTIVGIAAFVATFALVCWFGLHASDHWFWRAFGFFGLGMLAGIQGELRKMRKGDRS